MAMTFNRISKYRTMEISFMVFDTQMVYCTHPRKLVNNLSKALESFTLGVWMGVILVMAAIATFLGLFNCRIFTEMFENERVSRFDRCIMSMAILVEQSSSPRIPVAFKRIHSYRLAMGLYLIAAMVLTMSFKGNLLAALVSLDLEKPILTSQVRVCCYVHKLRTR